MSAWADVVNLIILFFHFMTTVQDELKCACKDTVLNHN